MVHFGRAMNMTLNGNGNSRKPHVLIQSAKKKATLKPGTPLSSVEESQVTFKTSDGVVLHGAPTRITQHTAVFELYNPSVTPRLSETLKEFEITLQGNAIYSGGATVRNVLDAGTKIVCEATLREADWKNQTPAAEWQHNGSIASEFKGFLNNWQKLYKVEPEFKVIIADMQSFLHDLRAWLERMELKIQAFPKPLQAELEKKLTAQLAAPIIDAIDNFIGQFESIVTKLESEAHPSHYAYLRRQLHSFVLLSPFAHRAFEKPLGYAGDYLMVDMMLRPPNEGATLFAKIINVWLLEQSPAQAHRNRVSFLEKKLREETMRVKADGRIAKIYNMGCGPATEVQRFFSEHICRHADFTLVDFNEETLGHLQIKLDDLSQKAPHPASYRLMKKSVNQI